MAFRSASFFGGTPNAIDWWKEVYMKYHDYWLFKRGAFVGQDQRMFNSLSLLFPGRIITVWPSDPYAPASLEDRVNPLGVCGDMYVLIPRPYHPVITLIMQTSNPIDPNFDAQPVVLPLFPFLEIGTTNDWRIVQVAHLAHALANLLSR